MPGISPSELERIDQALKTQLDILRHSAATEGEVLRVLEQMKKELIAKLAQGDITEWGRARLNQMLKDASATIAVYYVRAQEVLAPTYQTVAGISAAQTATALAVTAPPRAVLESLVSNMLVEGAPMKAWWAKQSADTHFKFSAAVRQGIAQSETLNQIFKRVNDATDLANRNSIALVHTSIMQVMNDANIEVIKQNADVAPQVEWLATLDSHTCWSAETLILMADGTQKPLHTIKIGDIVIGGVTGEPCRVIATGKRTVESSVVIHYNSKIIGRVTHDHPVLTKSGWKEIGSVSLSADISERQVLCRSFSATEETLHGASEIRRGRRGIRPAQCDTEARQADDDNPRIEPDPAGSVCDGSNANQGAQHESPSRLQHDERRGGCSGHCTGNIEGDGESALEAVQRGCRIPGENACGGESLRAEGSSNTQGIQCHAGGEGNNSSSYEFCMAGKDYCEQQASAHTGRETEDDCGGQEGLARPSTPCEGERSTGSEASGTTRYEPRMGCSARGENVCFHEGKMGRPCISCEDGATKAPCNCAGGANACSSETKGRDDSGEACCNSGEDPPTVGKKESVTIGIISGIEDYMPVEVFNITVESDHSYVAGGIIVHNCMICAPRDGLRWDTRTGRPIGHNLPYADAPIHVGCRCRLIPVTEFSDVGIGTPLEGERASTFGPVPSSTTFAQFLKRQSPEWQDEVLGKGRGELYRKGVITLRDLVGGRGNMLTLKQLSAKYNQ